LISETGLQSHTNRVINNITTLTSMAQSYNNNIRKLCIGADLSASVSISSTFPQVPNAANQPNNIDFGGVNGIVFQSASFNQISNIRSVQEASSTPVSIPNLTNIVKTSYTNYGGISPISQKLNVISNINQVAPLSKNILNSSGLGNVSFPTDILLADINAAAHCEQLFYSIIPTKFNGLGQKYLDDINNLCTILPLDPLQKSSNLNNPNLLDPSYINSLNLKIVNVTESIRSLIKKERQTWSEDMLLPPVFPVGSAPQTINQMAICETIINISQTPELQGILASCISNEALQILQN